MRIDIVPDGKSLARRPRFDVIYDGRMAVHQEDSWDKALASAIGDYAWPGGYVIEYTTSDGDVVCAKCAREHYVETGKVLHGATEGDNYGMGTWCDWCNEVIIEPCCAECGDEADGIMFGRNDGSVQICSRDMATFVHRGIARKTGKGEYTIDTHDNDAPWYGGGIYRAHWVDAREI